MTSTTGLVQDLATREANPANPRRNGKIARLPKPTRDMINRMLDDGLPARVIIDELGEAGHGLNAQNLTNWVHGGYQDYLRHQDALQRAKLNAEFVTELLSQTGNADPAAIHRACQIVAGTQLLAVLQDHGDQALANLLQREPRRYLPMLNTLCHMSHSSLEVQKHQDDLSFRQTMAAMRASSGPALSSQIKVNQASTDRTVTDTAAPLTSTTCESSQIKVNQASADRTVTDNAAPLNSTARESSQIKVNQAASDFPEITPNHKSEIKNQK